MLSVFSDAAKFLLNMCPGISTMCPMILGLKDSLCACRDNADDNAVVTGAITLPVQAQTFGSAYSAKSACMKSDGRDAQLALIDFVELQDACTLKTSTSNIFFLILLFNI